MSRKKKRTKSPSVVGFTLKDRPMGMRAVLELSDGSKARMNAAVMNGFVETFADVMSELATLAAARELEESSPTRH